MKITRLSTSDVSLARTMLLMMGEELDDPKRQPLSDEYLTALLNREEVWEYVALVDHEPVGGLTAYELPMTRSKTSELLVYDLAVRADWQRRGDYSADTPTRTGGLRTVDQAES